MIAARSDGDRACERLSPSQINAPVYISSVINRSLESAARVQIEGVKPSGAARLKPATQIGGVGRKEQVAATADAV
jgi:hypothetical protein